MTDEGLELGEKVNCFVFEHFHVEDKSYQPEGSDSETEE